MSLLLAAPILIPLTAAVLCVLAWRHRTLQRGISIAGAAGLLASAVALFQQVAASGPVASQMGNWPAPFGITLVADTLACVMLLINGFIAVCIVLFSLGGIGQRREAGGYHALVHGMLAAVSGAFVTGDIFNLYVWFEVMLMASFVLMTLGGQRGQLEGATKYVTLSLISSMLFLSGVGVLYAVTGTLNMADLAVKFAAVENSALAVSLGLLFFVSFGIKAAVFPMFFWLPASYQTPPPVIAALFAGLLSKVGVYAIIRTFTLIFSHEPQMVYTIMLAVSGLTMIIGVFGAAVQTEIRRILAFHSVSQIGYMLMGLAVAGAAVAGGLPGGTVAAGGSASASTSAVSAAIPEFAVMALAGTVLFLVHHAIVKTNLFLVGGIVLKLRGTTVLARLGDLYLTRPWLAVLFMVTAMSLAGVPVATGFWAKLVLVRAGLAGGQWLIVAAALGTGVLTLYSMTKIWSEAFWKVTPEPADLAAAGKHPTDEAIDAADIGPRGVPVMMTVVALMAVATVALGVLAGPCYRVAERAARELLEPQAYIRAVLGPTAGRPAAVSEPAPAAASAGGASSQR